MRTTFQSLTAALLLLALCLSLPVRSHLSLGQAPLLNSPFAILHAQVNGQGGLQIMHSVRLTADCTDASSTALQNPCANVTTNTGPQVGFPASPLAQTYQLDCDWHYSQATNVADNIGVKFDIAPTNAQLGGIAATNATAFAAGTPATITNTTATNVVSFTPAVTTVLYAHFGGVIELPATNQDINMTILVAQATAGNVIVSKRGSVCRWWAMQ